MADANLPYNFMGEYVARVQQSVLAISQIQQRIFLPDGSVLLRGDLSLGGNDIFNANSISVGTLHYTALDPPISSGGNISGPISSTNHALVRYDGTSGQVVLDSPFILSDDGKLTAPGGTIDLSTPGVINLSASLITVAGYNAVASVISSAIDSDIVVFAGTNGYAIKTSGIPVSSIATKLPLAGGAMTGNIAMGNNSLTGVLNIAGATKTSAVDSLVTSSAGSAVDSDIAVFDSTTGKIIKSSGVAVSSITAKLPLAGGTMTGSINMNNFNLTNVVQINGSVKTNSVNDLITSATGAVVAGNLPIWSGTTGRILSDSGISAGSLVIGATSAVDNALARFDLTSGKLIQSSAVTLSDDAKFAGPGGTIDLSSAGVINLIAGGSVQVNGSAVLTAASAGSYVSGPASAINNRIAAFDLATGKLIKDSGILYTDVTIGPASATDNAIARFDLTSGKLIQNSSLAISDDAKLSGSGGVIDFGAAGVLALTGTSILINGSAAATSATLAAYVQGPASSASDNVATYNGATGKIIKDSGVAAANLVQSTIVSTDNAVVRFDGTTGRVIQNSSVTIGDDAKIAANSATIDLSVSNTINLVATSVLINGSAAVSAGSLSSYVQGPASSVSDNIATYNGVTGKLIKDSGVAIGAIAAKLPLAGGVMTGSITMGANNLLNVGIISGAVKSNTVDDIVTGTTSTVVDSDIPIWSGTTGRVLKTSSIPVTSIVIGPASSTDNAIARFDLTTGKLIQSSSVSLSDDAKIAGLGGTIDFSTAGVLDLVAISVRANGSAVVTSAAISGFVTGPASAVDNNIPVFDLTTGKLIRDSGVAVTAIAAKLPLAGGTMSGNIAMGNNSLTGVLNIAGSTKTSAVNDIVTSSTGTVTDSDIVVFDSTTGRLIKSSSVGVSTIALKLALAGGTMTGSINMGTNNITNVSLISFPSGNVSLGVAATGGNAIAIGNSSTAASAANTIAMGTTSTALTQYSISLGNICNTIGARGITIGGGNLGINNSQSDGIAIGSNMTLGVGASGIAIGNGAGVGTVSNAIALGTAASNSIASSFLFGDAAIVNIRPNNTGTCDLGTSGARFKDLLLSGSISGATNSRTADNIVSNAGSGTSGNVATFSGATGKIIQDGGVALSALATTASISSTYLALAGGTMSGSIAMGGNSLTGVLNIAGSVKTSAVDSLVTSSAASSSDSDIAVFDLTTGKIIKNSGIQVSTIAAKLALAGGTMAGVINMGTNNITNIGSISGAVKTSAVDAIVTSSAGSAVDSDIAIFDSTTGKIIKNSSIQVSTIATKLPLAGGTMTGAINMGTNNITNIGSISGAVKTSAVDAIVTSSAGSAVDSDIAIFDSTTGKIIKNSSVQVSAIATKLPLAGGTMSGNIVMGNNSLTGVLNIAGATKTSAVDSIVTSSAAVAVDSDIAIFDSTTGKIIKNSSVQVSTIALKLALAGGTMTGAINMGTNNITNIGSISGAVKTSAVDAIVTSSAGSAVDSDIAVFDLTTGKIIKSSGVAVASIATKLPLAGGTMSGSIAMGTNNITNIGSISGAVKTSAVDAIVTSSAGLAVDSDIAVFDSTTGKIIKNSSIQVSTIALKLPLAGGTMTGAINMNANNITNIGSISGGTNSRTADNIVSNIGTSTNGNVAIFSGVTGKVISDSGSSLSQYALLSGATFTGAISMGANNITGTGTFSAGVLSATNTTASTSPTTGALLSAGGLGVAGKIYSGSNHVIGAVQTMAIEHALTLRGTDSSATLGPHIAAYTATDQYPIAQMYNFAHDNSSLTWDAYNDGVSWKSSYATSNYQMIKNSNRLTFNVSPGATVGTAVTWTAAGFINTTGMLKWNKPIEINDVTASSSTATGCLVLSGGIGVAGAMTIAGTITATGSISGGTNSRTVDNIVSNAGSGTVGNIVTVANVSGKVVQDSGTALSALATNASVAATYLPLAGGTMSGTINMATSNITNIGSISGATKTSAVDSIVTSSVASSVDSDIVVFDSTTGKIVKSSGVAVASIAAKLPLAGGTMTGSIAMGTNNLTNVGTISGATNSRTADNIVSNAGVSTSGNVTTFSGATGKVIQDSGTALSALATNASVAATYLPLAGGTMTGSINMGGNDLTGVSVTSTQTLAVLSTATNTSATTGAATVAGSLGVNGVIRSGNHVIVGPTSALGYENRLTLFGANADPTGPHILGYTGFDSFPVYQILGQQHDDIAFNMDAYWDGTWKSGSSGSNFVIRKISNQLRFIYNSGVTAGSALTLNTAGFIDTSGILQWQKQIKTADTTASTSAVTGSLVVGGGIGASGSLFLTGSATIPGSLTGATNTRTVDNIVSNAGGSTNGNVAIFSGATGKVISDSGSSLSQYALLSGATFTGTVAMGANNITGTGAISAGTLALSGTTASTSPTTGTLTCAGGVGVSGKIYSGDNHVIGAVQTIAIEQALTLRGANASATLGPHIVGYTATDQYPLYQITGQAHNNIAIGFDYYWDGVWKSGSPGSNFSINKQSNQLQFNYNSSILAGSAASLNLAGYIDTSGILQWQKPIKTADTTASTSTSSGSIIAGGGIGVAGKAYIGNNTVVGVAISPGTRILENVLTLAGTDSSATAGPAWACYTNTNQWPLMQCLPYAHDNIYLSFDAYYDGSWRTSSPSATFSLLKTSTDFQFLYTTGGAQGSAITWLTAGAITTAGELNWNKPISTSDTTASTSTVTGSITAAGGLGIGGSINLSGTITGASALDQSGASPLSIGATNATTLTLGRSGQLVTSAGIFNMTIPIGVWYCATTYNPAFSAGVNRLTPPTTVSAGTLVEFTHSAGVLTYTGTRTRNFVIEYDITWLAGASGASMTFFNSINASTTLATTQTRARRQINASNSNTFMHTHFSDIISLTTGQTVQLAGACATASTAVGYQFVSCKIYGLAN